MENILPFILETSRKNKESIFSNVKFITLSKMVYRGENMLASNSRVHVGHLMLLNRFNLFTLRNLEHLMFRVFLKKSNIYQIECAAPI